MMATLEEMALVLREKNPENRPMRLQWMAEQWWPDAVFLKARTNRHNGGSRVGGRAAGGFAGRLEKRNLLRCGCDLPRSYTWVLPDNAM